MDRNHIAAQVVSLVKRFLRPAGSDSAEKPPLQSAIQIQSTGLMRSNVEQWKALQEGNYFENHGVYQGLRDFSGDTDLSAIEWFTSLTPSMRAVVIGCGYGRETAHIARRVQHVYGIDVSPLILNKAARYLADMGIANFTPVLAENYKSEIQPGIDLVYSIVVMQHLTRDLVLDYFRSLGEKLSPSGMFIVQFIENLTPDAANHDAELRVYEPSVTWTTSQLSQLCTLSGLKFKEIRTTQMSPMSLWHWVNFLKI